MTDSLQNAFDAASQLPADQQDALAAWLLSELESERRWSDQFARSQDQLAMLARETLAEHRRGETQSL